MVALDRVLMSQIQHLSLGSNRYRTQARRKQNPV